MSKSPINKSQVHTMAKHQLVRQNSLTLYLRVRYSECDAQGVVFNARYADYADLAATEYLRALIGDYSELQKHGFENQVVSYHIDWNRAAVFDDVLSITVSTTHVGNTSFQFSLECSKRADKAWQTVANISITYVCVCAKSFEKQAIPTWLENAFAKSFSRSVNQAG
ncbi:acyl-CoA thioesterase [Glaciecola siphonariae]|uniref:Acyl-CoA thioesterase n=1 Tax=Glaciecola siphonariae TaxID=521012 RepID=A0ABV9LVP2_9ALTE